MKPSSSYRLPLRRSVPAGALFALGVCTILACDDHDEFRSDVVRCEEAAAALESCCPHGLTSAIKCEYLYEPNSVPNESTTHDCNGPGCGCNSDRLVTPDLSEDVSACILGASCDTVFSKCDVHVATTRVVCK